MYKEFPYKNSSNIKSQILLLEKKNTFIKKQLLKLYDQYLQILRDQISLHVKNSIKSKTFNHHKSCKRLENHNAITHIYLVKLSKKIFIRQETAHPAIHLWFVYIPHTKKKSMAMK